MAARRAFLIDASVYIFRAWFAVPERWHTADGLPLNAVYGYTRFVLEFLETTQPLHCAAAFDQSLGTCFRNDIYPPYKSSRELPDDALAFQLRACRELTELIGIPCYGGERHEADDYLATLAARCHRLGIPVTVVTRDKDLGQILVGDEDQWWDYTAGVSLNREDFSAKYGVRPEQFADYLALAGDPVDDIPGVPGVGPRTAAALLRAFGGLQQLRADLDRVSALPLRGATGLRSRLADHWPTVELSRALSGLDSGVPGITDLPVFRLTAAALERLAAYLEGLNLQGPLTRRCEVLAGG
jgi:5'-3' exonuclease